MDIIGYRDVESRLEPFYLEKSEDRRGGPRYHPVMLLKEITFGYCAGVHSSRQLDRPLERDMASRALAANQQPDSHTMSDYRKDHRKESTKLFVDIVQLCQAPGMVDLGEVANVG